VRWRSQAACLTEDPELFFPVGTSGPALVRVREAKSVCSVCPVQAACLDWALEHHADHGVWGGLDEQERIGEWRRRARLRAAAI
jgi:WhiB family redox-sensing transcriptional regulator